jgi:N6-adenosine-specific RNA methylase IME4
VNPSELKLHPDSHLIPEMRPGEYASFLADIRERGVTVPIEVMGRIVLDGRHRLRAALDLGLPEVPVREIDLRGEDSAAYIVKAACLRRHLTDDVLAAMAALWAKENPRPTGGAAHGKSAPTGGGVKTRTQREQPALAEGARLMGVTEKKARKAAEILRKDPGLLEKVHVGEIKIPEAMRRIRRAEAWEAPPLPDGHFRVILADPPWQYDNSGFTQSAEFIYPTMTMEAISALAVPALAGEDSVLYLWATDPLLPEALAVMKSWGFSYKAKLTWKKNRQPGMGFWFHGYIENLLVGVHGRPGTPATIHPNFLEAPVGRHSEKPAEIYGIIESMFPGPYLELFARNPRKGWTAWGNQLEGNE